MGKSLHKKSRKERIQGPVMLLSGLILLGTFFIWKFHQARILSFNTQAVEVTSQDEGTWPIKLTIPRLRVDLEVREAAIIDGVWQISPDSASHLNVSSGLGGSGNTIIYGHNKNGVLGPIRWMSPGDIIELTGEDGKIYTYSVEKTVEVEPDNLEYISPKDYEVLTIYTCTGFLDSKRFIIVAKRV